MSNIPQTRLDAFEAINTERDYQDQVWQNSGNNGPNVLAIGEFILLLSTYVDDAADQFRKEPKPEINALNTIRKIAGIAVNCMEQHGAPKREN